MNLRDTKTASFLHLAVMGMMFISYCLINIKYDFQRIQTEIGRDTHRGAGAHWQALSTKDQSPRPQPEFRNFRPVAIMQKDGTLIQRAKVDCFK